MAIFKKTSFRRRLIWAGVGLLGFVLMAAIALYLSVRQYSFHLERSTLAQRVYSSYQAVSDHTYRKLNAMREIVNNGSSIVDLEARYANQQALRDALQEVHDSVAAEFAHVGDANESAELDQLIEIERIAEQIIRGSESVRQGILAEDRVKASHELERLRSDAIEGKFTRLIDEALAEEQREVREAKTVVKELGVFVTSSLPFLLVIALAFGATLIYATSVSLTRSIRALEGGAKAYTEGDFDHRIAQLDEVEFSRLANALNAMASELATRRETDRISQESLESLIRLRTTELETSNKKLAAVSETRKQFLADISHELRTPLTIIRGESDMALREENKSEAQYVDALTRVREQAIHTTRLVQDLLFVARAEEGKSAIHRRSAVIATVVKEVCRDFKVLAGDRGISIEEHYADEQLVCFIDEGRIKQVITVLLDNAVRYSSINSTISVALVLKGDNIQIQIKDTGIGISDDEAENVFTRFYRGGDAATASTGSGLGLPVAKAIIDAHGGQISLQGSDGDGTTATVLLPVEQQLRAA